MNPNDPLFDKPERIGLRNPLKDDFTFEYDKHGDNPKTYTIRSQEIAYFPYNIGQLIKKNLYDAVINARELNPTLPKNQEEVMNDITV